MRVKEKEKKKQNVFLLVMGRIGLTLLSILLALVVLLYFTMALVILGPSKSARDLFVNSCMETSFAKYFPPMYISNEAIANIRLTNKVVELDDVTDTDNVDFSKPDETQNVEQPDFEIVELKGTTYKGRMIIVKDPSRIIVSGPDSYGAESSGLKVDEMLEKENGIAAINAGGFSDESGMGNGGVPIGIVIRNGELMYGAPGSSSVVIGFDNKNVLHVGRMTAKEAMDKGIRDAVSFGPALIVNGQPAQYIGRGGGLNPRTAIGQRADGSVLLLAIDGRQPNSVGASYKDLIDIFTEYGAINAGNLDGGSSTMMYYNGELINTCASLYGPRKVATAFVVLKEEDSDET